MKLKKVLKDIEYTTKQTLSYYIMAFKKVEKNEKIELENYIKAVIEEVENIEQTEILKTIDTGLIAEFPFYHTINNEELLAYAIIVFDRLLNSNREFNEYDIVKELEVVMKLNSSRNILYNAEKILENKGKKYDK